MILSTPLSYSDSISYCNTDGTSAIPSQEIQANYEVESKSN